MDVLLIVQLQRIEDKLDTLIAALSEEDEKQPHFDLDGNELPEQGEYTGTL